MQRIDLFKKHLDEKRAVKVIAGIDNFNLENVKKVVNAANVAHASAIDISADKEIIEIVKNSTELPMCVSSIEPEKLAKAVEYGADAIEIGNYDALYKKGTRMNAHQILNIVEKTLNLINKDEIFVCATVPGHIDIKEQIELAQKFEKMGIDLIQTEGSAILNATSDGARGLLENAQVSIANTIELSRNVEIPVMCASGLTSTTVPLAFAAGASAVGIGSCINKCNNEISMIATAKSIVESVSKKANDLQLA